MGVDIKSLSPKAQKQVYEKLISERKLKAGAKFASDEGKLMPEDESPSKRSKYGAKKVTVNGIQFDSKREARRYLELSALEMAGQIRNLQLQVKFELIPAQWIGDKVVERKCDYVADFTYYDKDGWYVVEDSKGHRTKDYIIKRKLMLYIHKIRITEV